MVQRPSLVGPSIFLPFPLSILPITHSVPLASLLFLRHSSTPYLKLLALAVPSTCIPFLQGVTRLFPPLLGCELLRNVFLPQAPYLITIHSPGPSQHFNPFSTLHLIHSSCLPLTDHVHIFLICYVFVSPPPPRIAVL